MTEPRKGRKLAYVALLRALDPCELYSQSQIMQFALENGFVKAADDDNRDLDGNLIISHKELIARLAQTLANYQKRLPIEESETVVVHGRPEPAWYGCQWQRYVLNLSDQEGLVYDLVQKRLTLARREKQVAWAAKMKQRQQESVELDQKIAALEAMLQGFGSGTELPLPIEGGLSLLALTEANAPQTGPDDKRDPAQGLPKHRQRLWAVAAFLFVSLVVTASGAMMGLSPFDILRQFGLAAAKADLSRAKVETPETLYQKSWLAFLDGDHEVAEKNAYSILSDNSSSLKLQADCFYLLGGIQAKRGYYLSALGHYMDAYMGYSEQELLPHQYQVALEIANAYVSLNDYESTENWMGIALDHYRTDQSSERKIADLGQYYLVKLEISAGNGDYVAALRFAKARLEQALENGDRANLSYANGMLGFWYIVNGCPAEGLRYTDRASEAAQGLGDDRPGVFVLVNRVLFQRRFGDDVEPQTIAYIRDWAKMKDDSRLEEFLNLALRIKIEDYENDCDTGPDER